MDYIPFYLNFNLDIPANTGNNIFTRISPDRLELKFPNYYTSLNLIEQEAKVIDNTVRLILPVSKNLEDYLEVKFLDAPKPYQKRGKLLHHEYWLIPNLATYCSCRNGSYKSNLVNSTPTTQVGAGVHFVKTQEVVITKLVYDLKLSEKKLSTFDYPQILLIEKIFINDVAFNNWTFKSQILDLKNFNLENINEQTKINLKIVYQKPYGLKDLYILRNKCQNLRSLRLSQSFISPCTFKQYSTSEFVC